MAGGEAGRLAPLIRDQGNTKLVTGDVANAVMRGVLFARDTEGRLQQQGLAKPHAIEEWVSEAGPKYFDETVAAVALAAKEAEASIGSRPSSPYRTGK